MNQSSGMFNPWLSGNLKWYLRAWVRLRVKAQDGDNEGFHGIVDSRPPFEDFISSLVYMQGKIKAWFEVGPAHKKYRPRLLGNYKGCMKV